MKRRLRSQDWFDNPDRIDQTALYLERFMNFGLTPEELRGGRPIIGIAQSGSDLNPCNRIHLELAQRVRDGIRDAGGIAIEFPTHPVFENCRRPTAALDRNLAYLGLVELLHGYPFDGVVLTTGCDKTTPFQLMAAATVDLPVIVLSGGPMLDGVWQDQLAGSGTVIWQARRQLAAGEIDAERFLALAAASAPSAGHCNTMGTASTMNALAEALGMSLPGCAAIPAPYRERGQMAYRSGRRAVELVQEDLRPSQLLTREAFLDAIVVLAALGGSSNAQPHLTAIARHAGVALTAEDWTAHGHRVPRLLNMQPAGQYLGERFHRAGGVPALMWELERAGLLHGERRMVSGLRLREQLQGRESWDREMIRPVDQPWQADAGLLVLRGNLFDFAVMKTSVIGAEFRARYLSRPSQENVFECRSVVFDSAEDYHARIDDPQLGIDEDCMLVLRGAGPLAWPGAAEVVNMRAPEALIRRGVRSLPTLGDGRQSGTSDSPSILHASPEAAAGGGLARLRSGDRIRVDLHAGRCDALVAEAEWAAREPRLPCVPAAQTPWQQLYRQTVGGLDSGACLELAVGFRAPGLPRHNH